jgi:hypothetical protein
MTTQQRLYVVHCDNRQLVGGDCGPAALFTSDEDAETYCRKCCINDLLNYEEKPPPFPDDLDENRTRRRPSELSLHHSWRCGGCRGQPQARSCRVTSDALDGLKSGAFFCLNPIDCMSE